MAHQHVSYSTETPFIMNPVDLPPVPVQIQIEGGVVHLLISFTIQPLNTLSPLPSPIPVAAIELVFHIHEAPFLLEEINLPPVEVDLEFQNGASLVLVVQS